MRGLDPTDKSARLANYILTLRKEILQLCRACGYQHPAMMTTDSLEMLQEGFSSISVQECFGLVGTPPTPSAADLAAIEKIMCGEG